MKLAARPCRRWLLYALGGGLGHLTRAVALSRAAARYPGDGERPRTEIVLLTNSPFAGDLPISNEIGGSHRVVTLCPELSRDETAARVIDLVQSERYDALVVDTFPRGLGGELFEILPELACQKVLVHRDLSPRYCERFKLREFVQHFDRLLVPGESAPFEDSPHAIRTEPWLIRDESELLPSAEARRILKVESDTLPVVAVIGCGRLDEIKQMRCLATQLTSEFASVAAVRFITLSRHGDDQPVSQSHSGLTTISLWPFFQAIRGVSLIVGSGGYNSVHEARATRTKFIGLSWPRLYDRQQRRLSECERAADFQQVRQQVSGALASFSHRSSNSPPRYRNGVHKAIETVEALYA